MFYTCTILHSVELLVVVCESGVLEQFGHKALQKIIRNTHKVLEPYKCPGTFVSIWIHWCPVSHIYDTFLWRCLGVLRSTFLLYFFNDFVLLSVVLSVLLLSVPNVASGLSPQNSCLKKFLIFFPKKPSSEKVSYIFSKRFF